MLIFEKIRFKNLLSFGNTFTEFDLTQSKSTLFQGESGSGKSTILTAFCFGLFGKPFASVKKGNIVNAINNSACLVEIEFRKGSRQYKVVRGQKPNIFEIYEDGLLILQDAKILDYQEFFEKQILKFNMKSFLQISILGAANFIPFMQLSAAERRNIIEEILDIKSFSLMNDILKQDLQDINQKELKLNHAQNLINNEIKVHQQYKDKAERDNSAKIEQLNLEATAITEKLVKIKEKIFLVTDKLKLVQSLKEDILTNIRKLQNDQSKISHAYNISKTNLLKRRKYFEEHTCCDTCEQDINLDHKSYIMDAIDKDLSLAKDSYEIENSKIIQAINELQTSDKNKEYDDTETKLKNALNTLKETANINQLKIDSYKKEIKQLTDTMFIKGSVSDEDQIINQLKEKSELIQNELKELLETKQIFELASKLLKDDGIKTDIIKEYLPYVNALINDYLQKMNFFVTFSLDEKFNEQIKSRGRDDFEYNCFSEGEKQRLDLAILFAWRNIAKIKNSLNTNLLIMDEIADSKLNNEAAEGVWEVLKSQEFDESNVFVISHKNTIQDKFQAVYSFKKNGNFSEVKLSE